MIKQIQKLHYHINLISHSVIKPTRVSLKVHRLTKILSWNVTK